MASNKRAAGVDNTHRKTWDKTDYEDKAKERQVKVGRRHSPRTCSHTLAGCAAARPSPCRDLVLKVACVQEKEAEDSSLDIKKRKRLGVSRRCRSPARTHTHLLVLRPAASVFIASGCRPCHLQNGIRSIRASLWRAPTCRRVTSKSTWPRS